MTGGHFHGFAGELAVFRIGKVEALVAVSLADAISQAAANLHALVLIELLQLLQASLVNQRVVAHHLDINFVNLEIARQVRPGPGGVEVAVHQTLHGSLSRVSRDNKTLVIALGLNRDGESSDCQKRGQELSFSHKNSAKNRCPSTAQSANMFLTNGD